MNGCVEHTHTHPEHEQCYRALVKERLCADGAETRRRV